MNRLGLSMDSETDNNIPSISSSLLIIHYSLLTTHRFFLTIPSFPSSLFLPFPSSSLYTHSHFILTLTHTPT